MGASSASREFVGPVSQDRRKGNDEHARRVDREGHGGRGANGAIRRTSTVANNIYDWGGDNGRAGANAVRELRRTGNTDGQLDHDGGSDIRSGANQWNQSRVRAEQNWRPGVSRHEPPQKHGQLVDDKRIPPIPRQHQKPIEADMDVVRDRGQRC